MLTATEIPHMSHPHSEVGQVKKTHFEINAFNTWPILQFLLIYAGPSQLGPFCSCFSLLRKYFLGAKWAKSLGPFFKWVFQWKIPSLLFELWSQVSFYTIKSITGQVDLAHFWMWWLTYDLIMNKGFKISEMVYRQLIWLLLTRWGVMSAIFIF